MEEDLTAFLLADAGFVAVFGDRLAWLKRPDAEAIPALTLQIVSGPLLYTQRGALKLADPLVQCDVWASDYAGMKAGERAVLAVIERLRTSPFKGAFVEGRRHSTDDQDGPDASGSITFFRSSIDARIWHAAAGQ